MTDTLLQSARTAAKLARDAGADESKAILSHSRSTTAEWRDGQLDRLQDRTQRSLRLELLVDGRFSSNATNDLRPDALEQFIGDAVAMTRLLEPDPCRGLPDPSRYPTSQELELDLDLFDPSRERIRNEDRLARARELESLVRDRAGGAPIVSVSARVSDASGESARVHSNGLEATSRGTSFSQGVQIVLKQPDGRRPTGASFCVRRHASDMPPAGEIARDALERAIAQLDSGRLPTGRYTIVVENRAVGRLLRMLLAPLAGSALQQKRSVWDGKLGELVTSPLLTLIDEPRRPRGLAASIWDGDGLAARRRPLVESGVLRTYLIDQYYARKLGVDPPGGSTHDLEWSLGTQGPEKLIGDVDEGVFLDRFIGGNSNDTTGEFSLGCGGRRIHGGTLGEPVSEVNLSGSFIELWKSLRAVGNDPDPDSAASCPTCVFENVQLSGL